MCFSFGNDQVYERTLKLESFKIVSDDMAIDVGSPAGTTYQLTESSTVTMIDPYENYIAVLKECFDFEKLKTFIAEKPEFSILFDGMHGAGGPFAQRVLVNELGVPEVSGQLPFQYRKPSRAPLL